MALGTIRRSPLLAAGIPLAVALLSRPAAAQRVAAPEDFVGLTRCEAGRAVSQVRADVRDSLQRAQIEAHEAVHRRQAEGYPSCEAFMASVRSARQIIEVELPAYCAQWRIAVAQGAPSEPTRREFGWRIAAQSGAMENRLQVLQRFERECPLVPPGAESPAAGQRGGEAP